MTSIDCESITSLGSDVVKMATKERNGIVRVHYKERIRHVRVGIMWGRSF